MSTRILKTKPRLFIPKPSTPIPLPTPTFDSKTNEICSALNASIASDHKLTHRIVDWIAANGFQPAKHSICQAKHYLFAFPSITVATRKILISELKLKAFDIFIDMMAIVDENEIELIMTLILRSFGKKTPDLLLTRKELSAVAKYAETKNVVGYYWIQRFLKDYAADPEYFVVRPRKGAANSTVEPLPDAATYSFLSGESIDQSIDGHGNAAFVKCIYNFARIEIFKDTGKNYSDEEIEQSDDLCEYLTKSRAILDARLRLGSLTGHLSEQEAQLFREHGPRNPPYYVDDDTDPSESFMFTCTSNDYDEEIEEPVPFSGRCQRTGLLLKSRRHCVRIPKRSGGWEGWFCSIEKAIAAAVACEGEDMIWEIAMLEEVKYLLEKYGVYQK